MVRRNGNNRQRDAGSVHSGLAIGSQYKNTVFRTLQNSTTPAGEISFKITDLCDDITSRTVVIERILVEVLPAEANSGQSFFAQITAGPAITGNNLAFVAMSPYKAISHTVPTMLVLDLRRLATVAPLVLRPLQISGSTVGDVMRFKVDTPPGIGISLRFRVTTFARVMPETLIT